MTKEDRIKERLIEIEIGMAKGLGWNAVGVVKRGFDHEKGLRFEVAGADALQAERRLTEEIEAYFA